MNKIELTIESPEFEMSSHYRATMKEFPKEGEYFIAEAEYIGYNNIMYSIPIKSSNRVVMVEKTENTYSFHDDRSYFTLKVIEEGQQNV